MSTLDTNTTVTLAKIDWYRELLHIEPNSKSFLSFARLLAQVGLKEPNSSLINEAFAVLRHGLTQHPEFMEARLFHIELLNICDCRSQCGAEVARLASLFLSYPDFWDAWREHSIHESDSPDFSVALGFMSAIMRDKSISILQVLEAGLTSLQGSTKKVPHQTCPIPPAVIPPTQASPSQIPSPVSSAQNQTTALPQAHKKNYESFVQQQENSTQSPQEALTALLADSSIVVEPIESSPFKTRSMADVLTQQGNFHEAIAIYEELLAKAKETDKPALQQKLIAIQQAVIGALPKSSNQPNASHLLAIDDLVDPSFATPQSNPLGNALQHADAQTTQSISTLLDKLASKLEEKATG